MKLVLGLSAIVLAASASTQLQNTNLAQVQVQSMN